MISNDGYDYVFDESKCQACGGKCCTGQSGYIWINKDEMKRLAEHLNLTITQFENIYTYKVGVRFSLKEKRYNKGMACVFFDEKNKNCGIYEFRPKQCKIFPFWEYFKKNYKELEQECVGIRLF